MDSLLESSADRIHSAAAPFHAMRQQQQPPAVPPLPQKYASAPIPPAKPALSPKPASLDRKLNNSSPLSTISNDSSLSGTFRKNEPPPPPPSRSFQPSSYSNNKQESDYYAKSRQQHPSSDHQLYSTASSATSTPTVKTFMKPSEFLSSTPGPKPFVPGPTSTSTPISRQPPEPPEKPAHLGGGGQVTKYSRGDSQSGSSFAQEYSQEWDSGPIKNEQVIETVNPDGSISLKRIFQEQQTSSTSKVTSTRKIFQQKQQENSSQEGSNR